MTEHPFAYKRFEVTIVQDGADTVAALSGVVQLLDQLFLSEAERSMVCGWAQEHFASKSEP